MIHTTSSLAHGPFTVVCWGTRFCNSLHLYSSSSKKTIVNPPKPSISPKQAKKCGFLGLHLPIFDPHAKQLEALGAQHPDIQHRGHWRRPCGAFEVDEPAEGLEAREVWHGTALL